MRLTTLPAAALLLATLPALALPGCGEAAPTDVLEADVLLARHGGAGAESGLAAEHRQELAALRALTAPFHDIEAAMAAGWSTELTPCLSHPTEGAMGHHYANMALLDGTVELLGPETLLYEPRRNGGMRLVAVEYLVPFDILPPDADAPELLGQHFHANTDAGVWALHVWIWRNNPAGMFADWNANVSCDWAD